MEAKGRKLEIMNAFFVVILLTFAAAISTYAGADPGTIGFTEQPITQTCYNTYQQSLTHDVLANTESWNNGANCGKLVEIVCADSSKCSTSGYIWGVITSVCETIECGATFTLDRDAYINFAPLDLNGAGVAVTYTYQ